jgi:hypothetical protein
MSGFSFENEAACNNLGRQHKIGIFEMTDSLKIICQYSASGLFGIGKDLSNFKAVYEILRFQD